MSSIVTDLQPMAPADWRKHYKPGSFRGQPFHILSAESEIGRRHIVHEFAKRDEAYSEDLGRKARRFKFEAIVLGAGYADRRDDLIAAFEKSGPGKLVHPWLGTHLVTIESTTITESTKEGGSARFTVTAAQVVDGATSILDVISAKANVVTKSLTTLQAAQAGFANAVKVTSGFVREQVTNRIRAATSEIRRINGTVATALGIVNDVSNSIDELESSLVTLIRTPSAVASTIADLWATVISAIGQVQAAADTPVNTGRLLQTSMARGVTFGADATPVAQTTPTRVIEAENQAAVTTFIRATALSAACATVGDVTFETADDATYLSTYISETVAALEANVDDETYIALQDMRAAVVAYLETVEAATLTTYVPRETLPALCIAYALYDDASQDESIILRNRLTNPVFVPGGVPLKVVANG